MDWEPAYLFFTNKATFYGGPIGNRRCITPNQSYDISAVKSNIKINVWGAICYSWKIDLHFYKEKKNSDVYINIFKRYIPKIKELVQDPFIIIRDNASYHCSQQTKEWIQNKNKVKEILDWPPNSLDLNPRKRLGNNKKELQKENISKRSILINKIKEIYFFKFHKNTLRTFLSHL